MKETIEHNNRFYTNEKGEIKTENEQLKEWLLIANKENERLKEEYMMLQNASDEVEEEKDREIERLNNIINEAIEVIDLVKPELWNISNKMTYRLLDIKNILVGDDKK